MSPTDHLFASSQQSLTVVMMDLAEYVRLVEEDQHETGHRWRRLVGHVRRDVLPEHNGLLVETRGDSLVLTFTQTQSAVQAAFAINRYCDKLNEGVPAQRRFLLRTGIHVGEVFTGQHEVSGHAVNLAARLMSSVAGPGEIVTTADVYDQLTPVLDADIEDLGECYLKHVREPVRAYRVGAPGPLPVIEPGTATMPALRPTIAIIPFSTRSFDPSHDVLGEVLADQIITAVSRIDFLNVISRLSTTVFRGRLSTLDDLGAHLKANYVLSGTYSVSGNRLTLGLELAEVRSGHVQWNDSMSGQIADIVNGNDPLIDRIVRELGNRVVHRELQRGQSQALPTLESYTLLMNAIVRMHRLSTREFERAYQMLQTLTTRIPRVALPHAWLAKWHVMRYNQGMTDDPDKESKLALDCTQRALDVEPECSLALTIDGFVHTNLRKDLDVGLDRYEQALKINPNESLAWLLRGTLHAFKGNGALAVEGTEHALKLSPLDPLRYFYESLAATAAHTAGQYERAIELAKQSLRSNRLHASTLRALTIAQSQLGRIEDARKTVSLLMQVEPNLTIRRYLENNPSRDFETGKVWSEALRNAGVPE